MKNTLVNFVLAGALAALPLVAASEESKMERSCEQVENMLKAGSAPAAVVSAMVDAGFALTGATVFAMECAPAANREAIAAAGVGLADNINDAEMVVVAVATAAGEDAPETKAARDALEQYKKNETQPKEYQGGTKPTGGGGVSPS